MNKSIEHATAVKSEDFFYPEDEDCILLRIFAIHLPE